MFSRNPTIVGAFAALLLAGAVAGSGHAMAQSGQEDYFTYCASCHGVEGRGDGTVAEFLTITSVDLTKLRKKYSGEFPRERLAGIIDGRVEVKVHGARDMPVWGEWFMDEASTSGVEKKKREELVAKRINDLVSYIESIQEK